jgi:hypothetical protein
METKCLLTTARNADGSPGHHEQNNVDTADMTGIDLRFVNESTGLLTLILLETILSIIRTTEILKKNTFQSLQTNPISTPNRYIVKSELPNSVLMMLGKSTTLSLTMAHELARTQFSSAVILRLLSDNEDE